MLTTAGRKCTHVCVQVYAKEEEVCELQATMQERHAALKAYEIEN